MSEKGNMNVGRRILTLAVVPTKINTECKLGVHRSGRLTTVVTFIDNATFSYRMMLYN